MIGGIYLEIFVGSSRESEAVAQEIAVIIESAGHVPIIWSDIGVFRVGYYTFESLELICKRVQSAVFVFAEDDKLWYRNDSVSSVRDNVLIEYGLFAGSHSRKNVCICCSGTPKIASDLQGITHINIAQSRRFAAELKYWLSNLPLNYKSNSIRFMSFLDATNMAVNYKPHFDNLRVFAITTSKSVMMLRSHPNLKIKTAEVLLRGYTKGEIFESEQIDEQVERAIKAWDTLKREGNILELSIKKFKHHPEDGFYIFDDSVLIYGNLYYYKEDNSIDFDHNVMVVTNETCEGADIINLFIKKFQNVLDEYSYEY